MRLFKWTVAALCLAVVTAPAGKASAQMTKSEAACAEAWGLVEKAGFSTRALNDFKKYYPACTQIDFATFLRTGKEGPEVTEGNKDERNRGWGPVTASTVQVLRQAVGVLATPNVSLDPVNGGYALILMKKGQKGNEDACKVFTRYLGFTTDPVKNGAIDVGGAKVYQLPVYWPATQVVPAQSATDCKRMLETYDYTKASTYLEFPAVVPYSRSAGPYLAIVRGDGRQIGLFNFSGLSGGNASRQFEGALAVLTQDGALQPSFYEEPSLIQRLTGWMNGSTTLAFKASLITLKY